jgi:hypothetical protein
MEAAQKWTAVAGLVGGSGMRCLQLHKFGRGVGWRNGRRSNAAGNVFDTGNRDFGRSAAQLVADVDGGLRDCEGRKTGRAILYLLAGPRGRAAGGPDCSDGPQRIRDDAVRRSVRDRYRRGRPGMEKSRE